MSTNNIFSKYVDNFDLVTKRGVDYLNELELKILIGLHRVVSKIDRDSSRVVSEYDLTLGQFGVLEALYHKGDLTIGQIQEKILSSTGTMPLIIKNLEKRDLVQRIICEADRRKCFIHLTDEGKKLIEEAYPKNRETVIDFMQDLSNEEKENMMLILKKLGEDKNEKNNKK